MVAANCLEEYGLMSRYILTCNVISSFHILLFLGGMWATQPYTQEKPIFMDIRSNYPMSIASSKKYAKCKKLWNEDEQKMFYTEI